MSGAVDGLDPRGDADPDDDSFNPTLLDDSTSPSPFSPPSPSPLPPAPPTSTPPPGDPVWSDLVDRSLMARLTRSVADVELLSIAGKVTRVSGIIVEATLPAVAVGTSCEIRLSPTKTLTAEVVGFAKNRALLMPFGDVAGVGEGCAVVVRGVGADIPVGDALLGRVVDAAMRPVDGGPLPCCRDRLPCTRLRHTR
jgi:hypothetical protein